MAIGMNTIRQHPYLTAGVLTAATLGVGYTTGYTPSLSILADKSTYAAQAAWGYLSESNAAKTATDYASSLTSALADKSTYAAQATWGYLSSTSAAETAWGYLSGETAKQAAEIAKNKWFGRVAAESAARQAQNITYAVQTAAVLTPPLLGWAAFKIANKVTRAVLGGMARKTQEIAKQIVGERTANVLGWSANVIKKAVTSHSFITRNIVLGATAYYTGNTYLKFASAGLLSFNILPPAFKIARTAVCNGLETGRNFITRKAQDAVNRLPENVKQIGKAISNHPFTTWNIALGAVSFYADSIILKTVFAAMLAHNLLYR